MSENIRQVFDSDLRLHIYAKLQKVCGLKIGDTVTLVSNNYTSILLPDIDNHKSLSGWKGRALKICDITSRGLELQGVHYYVPFTKVTSNKIDRAALDKELETILYNLKKDMK